MSLSARPHPITTYDKTINIYVLVTFCTDTYTCNMHFQCNVTLLLGQMELVVVELNADAEFVATECAKVASVELFGGMDLDSGCDRRMGQGHDERRESV